MLQTHTCLRVHTPHKDTYICIDTQGEREVGLLEFPHDVQETPLQSVLFNLSEEIYSLCVEIQLSDGNFIN